jgi:hypothetical protein
MASPMMPMPTNPMVVAPGCATGTAAATARSAVRRAPLAAARRAGADAHAAACAPLLQIWCAAEATLLPVPDR